MKLLKYLSCLTLSIALSLSAINTPSPAANGQKGIVKLLSPEPMGMGRLSISAYTLFGASSVYDSTVVKSSSLSDYFQSTNHLGISFGVNDFVDLNLRYGLAIDTRKVTTAMDSTLSSDKTVTLAKSNNLELGLKYAIWRDGPIKMGINIYTHIPIVEKLSGDDKYFSGNQRNFREEMLYTEKVGYGAQILAAIGSKGMMTYLNIGYMLKHSTKVPDVFSGGIGFEIAADDMTTVWGEFDGEFFLGTPKISPMRLGGGLKFNMPADLQLTGGVFGGINDEAPVWQTVLGMSWNKVVLNFDVDNDGILDKDDKCPENPEDKDGFEDEDGCPDLDNDQDGIADLADKCLNTPEDKDGFEDSDGCPEDDNDQDGILDADDKCPNDKEDVDGFEDLDGCPELDNDKDTILDTKDKCPLVAEDMDGFEDEDGCPEFDNDMDGITDDKDKCPNEKETVNGFEDEDGCPDAVILKKNDRIVMDNVYFKTGSSELTEDSYAVLDKTKNVFTDNPKIKIQIEGHTDNTGKAKINQKLSQERAASVRKYMIEKVGIKAEQLTSVGFGKEKPVADNKTPEGRAKNRRIEFKVISNE